MKFKINMRFWHVYFWLNIGLLLVAILGALSTWLFLPNSGMEQVGYTVVIDYTIWIVSLIGLYGYIHGIRTLTATVWRFILWPLITLQYLWSVISTLFMFQEISNEVSIFETVGWIITIILFGAAMVYALYMYSYRSPKLWANV